MGPPVLSAPGIGGHFRQARTDVLVVGGGPAGTAAAAAAYAGGMDVELVCGPPRGRAAPGESLPPGTDAVLRDTFGRSPLTGDKHRPSFGNRSAWGASRLDATDFMRNPFGQGWHLDRRSFDASLLNLVRARGVHVRTDARVARSAWRGDHWQVTLTGNREEEIHAQAIVDASGRAARVARSQGARRHRLDQLVAAYWTLEARDEHDHDCNTVVEAVADGWWYTTPIPGGRRVAAFLTDSDLLPSQRARTGEDWRQRLLQAPHIRQALAERGCHLNGYPVILDASVVHLEPSTGCGWVAAGDAAVSFDLLSSQGIVTALQMGSGAGHAVAAFLRDGDPQPLVRWAGEYARLLENHLRLRAACYALEQRWPAAPFWARRHSRAAETLGVTDERGLALDTSGMVGVEEEVESC